MKSIVEVFVFCSLLTLSYQQCTFLGKGDFPPKIFSYHTDATCYEEIEAMMAIDHPLNITYGRVYYKSKRYEVPGLLTEQGIFKPFSIDDKFIYYSVWSSYDNNLTMSRFKMCSRNGEKCCNDIMMTESHNRTDVCESIWDGYACFFTKPHGHYTQKECPKYMYSYNVPKCSHYAYQKCNVNGSWDSSTDYSECNNDKVVNHLANFQIAIHFCSILFLLPAAVVFATHETFKSKRNRLILFLIMAKIIESTIIILNSFLIAKNSHVVFQQDGWPCRTLTYFERVGEILTSVAMLLIILYLFLVLIMKQEYPRGRQVNMLPWYCLSTFITLASSLTWALLMAENLNENCWLITDELNWYIWIIDGTDIALTSIGIVLLCTIAYSYYDALRMKSINQQEIFCIVIATIYCMPSFVIDLVFLTLRPDIENCDMENFYNFLAHTWDFMKSLSVGLFYCYTEKRFIRAFREQWCWMKTKIGCSKKHSEVVNPMWRDYGLKF
ncbi:CALCRL family protein [Megaselia abdita]